MAAAASSGAVAQSACAAADRDVAANRNAAIAAQVLDADAAARFVFVPDNSVGKAGAAGPEWLAAAAVELRRNGSHLLVRSPSLVTMDGPTGAGGALLKVLSPAAMRGLVRLQP